MIRRPPRSTRTDTLFPYTTLFRSDELPGNNIAVMFQNRQHDAIAGLQVHPAPAVCDKVDPPGRPANKYNLAIRSRANELRHPPPPRFISQRQIGRAGVDDPMDRRILRNISAGDAAQHLLRPDQRTVGIEWVRHCRTRRSPTSIKKKT